MVIDTHTEIYDLLREYERTCVTITFKDGTSKKIFFLDVDDEYQENDWSPVNKIDNLNRDFFVLCHD
ncbi:hypothetical protein ikematsu_15010 [Limosilactobacillus fermentum]|nr:hypothetical protein ikematsu_15010 [Limosilactobacillus fermentum]